MNKATTFHVTTSQLGAGLGKAGPDLPDIALGDLPPKELRRLLERLADLAPQVEFPAVPALRIVGPQGQYLVQVKENRVRLSSWSIRAGAGDLSPADIAAIITGEGDQPSAASADVSVDLGSVLRPRRRVWPIAILSGLILGSNAVTAWWMTRPARDFLPQYQVVDPDAGARILKTAAGIYETGPAQGDRRLRLGADGHVSWEKFGDNKTVIEQTDLIAQAVRVNGRDALLTNTRAVIDVADLSTLIFYGDTYRRIGR